MFCNNCGVFFDGDLVVDDFDPETGPMNCCPFCGADDLSKSVCCSICGKDFLEDDLCEGFCKKCLWDAIDYDVMLAFLKENNLLAHFFISFYFKAGFLAESSKDLDAHLEETFRRLEANDKLFSCWPGDNPFVFTFLDRCKEYCLPNHQEIEFQGFDGDFAEWYAGYVSRKGKEEKT